MENIFRKIDKYYRSFILDSTSIVIKEKP